MAKKKEHKETKEHLRYMQSLPLDMKVRLTQQRIHEWVREFGEDGVYVSFSGGKDSTVLLDIVRGLYPDVPAVFVDTGLEYPEIREFVKTIGNVVWLKPEIPFNRVIKEKGYPVISKSVSHNVDIARRNPSGNVRKNLFSGGKKSLFNCARYEYLLDAPFTISDQCCNIMKKKPAHIYSVKTGRVAITAQMACESKLRETKWLQNGCNAFNSRNPVSNPMSFWTEQDVLLYAKRNWEEMVQKIIEGLENKYGCSLEEIIDTETGEPAYPRDKITPICSIYGDIVYDCDDPEQMRFEESTTIPLRTTGEKRTGCMFCMFGVQREAHPNRFERMKITHPKQWDYCINKLGCGAVMDYIGVTYGKEEQSP